MFTIESYSASIQANLEKNKAALVEQLQKVLSYQFDPAVDLLDYTAFIEPTRFELSIRMFSIDKDANEVFGDNVSLINFAGSAELVSDVSYFHLQEEQSDNFDDFYEQNDEELANKEQQIFTEWFAQCWEKAGGNAFNLPSYFGFHDETNSYDLQNARFVEDEDKWV